MTEGSADYHEKLRLLELLEEKNRRLNYSRDLEGYPNRKQLEFINSKEAIVGMLKANQTGGSWALGLLMKILMTLDPPEWYQGWLPDPEKTDIEVDIVAFSRAKIRDLFTDRLLGPQDARGSGWIPRDLFDPDVDIYFDKRSSSEDQIHGFRIRNARGGVTRVSCKIFGLGEKQRVQSAAGDTRDIVFIDEQASDEVYDEERARIFATAGIIRWVCCPQYTTVQNSAQLMDVHDVANPETKVVIMTIDDAEHLSEEARDRAKLIGRNSPLAMARLWAVPVSGEEQVWPIYNEQVCVVDDFEVPDTAKCIRAIDIPHGQTGNFACVLLCELGGGRWHVSHTYKASGLHWANYAAGCNLMAGPMREVEWIPVTYPKDAHRTLKTDDTERVVDILRENNLNLLNSPAYVLTPTGKKSYSKMVGVQLVAEKIALGLFTIARSCTSLIEEMRSYVAKDGFPKDKQFDDCIDALLKAAMSIEDYGVRRVDTEDDTEENLEGFQPYEYYGGLRF